MGERLPEDSAVYARLLSAEETGAWIAFVAGLSLLGVIDFRGVFLACAVACAAAAVVLLGSPSRPISASRESGTEVAGLGLGLMGRRLRPMLLAVAMTATAETAVAILLLLYLQRGFDLDVVEIAWVFLPGAIAMAVLPEHLHALSCASAGRLCWRAPRWRAGPSRPASPGRRAPT